MQAVESKAHDDEISEEEKSMYKGISVLYKLPYWNGVRMVRGDWMHLLGNVTKTMFKLLLGKDDRDFSADGGARNFEAENTSRWKEEKKMPFRFSTADIAKFTKLLKNLRWPMMHGNKNKPGDIFSSTDWLKTWDWLQYASDLGIVLILLSDTVKGDIANSIMRFLVCVKLLRQVSLPRDLVAKLRIFIIETLVLCELYLPTYIFGINFHLLIHACGREGNLLELGPAYVHHQFDQERRGGKVSDLSNSHKNPIPGIVTNHMLQEEIQELNFVYYPSLIPEYFKTPMYIQPGTISSQSQQDEFKIDGGLVEQVNKYYKSVSDMSPLSGVLLDNITINSRIFHTSSVSSRLTNNDNSGCMVLFEDEKHEGKKIYWYGIIEFFFLPDIKFTDGKKEILAKVKWKEITRDSKLGVKSGKGKKTGDSKNAQKSKKRKEPEPSSLGDIKYTCPEFNPIPRLVKDYKKNGKIADAEWVWTSSIHPVNLIYIPRKELQNIDYFVCECRDNSE